MNTKQDIATRDLPASGGEWLSTAAWVAATFVAVAVGAHTSVLVGILAAAVLYVGVGWLVEKR